ncbi:MAG: prolyl oligopeptidase family serine peptidase, partial [Halobacteriovoraceae bacterium]|nr:prolyl oligopeptidase family serine peptidase [Halobacteriovoraceae bacterium]
MTLEVPKAKKVPFETENHGHKRIDNYHWLRDDNWQKFIQGDLSFADPDVKTYIDAENSYTDETMKDTDGLQKELYETLVSRINEDDERPPMKHGDYFYYSKIEKGQDYRFHCRRKGSVEAAEEIYFDENIEAEGKGYYSLGAKKFSKGDKYLLLSENTTGSMEYSIRIKDLEKNEFLPWTIGDTTGNVQWCGDFEHIYYIERHPVNGRGQKIYRINIHEGPESKELIFDKPDNLSNLFMGIQASADHNYLFIDLGDTNSNELYYLKGKDPKAMPELFWKLTPDTLVDPDFCDGLFYIVSNEKGMVNNQLFTCEEGNVARENWKALLEHSSTHFLEHFDLYKGQLVYFMTNNELALPELYVRSLGSGETKKLPVKDAAYNIGYIGAMEFESESIQLVYEAPIRPREFQEFDLNSGTTKVIKEGHCPNFNSEDYQVERVFVPAHDEAKIPMTIVSKKGFKKDGSAPHFQYAYGSYGYGMPAFFSSNIFALIDKGFAFSVAHIRGGADKGYQWYLDGKMFNKINTFKDYISCTEYLIKEGYSSKGKVTANGGSAGGLLMGAISNMAPELYNSVILDVPFVDVITTILDDTLPLTPPEWNEWGNPIK